MSLPFTQEQFIEVFRHYNEGTWPAAFVLPILGVVAVGLLFAPGRTARKLVFLILGSLWVWTGFVYHLLYFARINPLAMGFALLSIVQAVLLLTEVFVDRRVPPVSLDATRVLAGALILYALAIYPLVGIALGHRYPDAATFGAPCPTTIFTLGVLAWMMPLVPWRYLLVPLGWAVIGTGAAVQFGMLEDIGLSVAALTVILMAMRRRTDVVPLEPAAGVRS